MIQRVTSYGLMSLLVFCSLMLTASRASGGYEDLGNVKILSQGVELVEVVPTAEKCAKQKGQTVKLRVTSESPVDVRLYAKVRRNYWLPKDFANQKRGDEIIDYRCDGNRDYKVYTHAAGSSEAWPKP